MACKDITDKQLLIARVKHGGLENGDPIQNLSEVTGQCYKVCYRCYERAIERGYMDYGVSVRTAWITHEGEQLIKNNEKIAIRHKSWYYSHCAVYCLRSVHSTIEKPAFTGGLF